MDSMILSYGQYAYYEQKFLRFMIRIIRNFDNIDMCN